VPDWWILVVEHSVLSAFEARNLKVQYISDSSIDDVKATASDQEVAIDSSDKENYCLEQSAYGLRSVHPKEI
jgi:hypothetical protein